MHQTLLCGDASLLFAESLIAFLFPHKITILLFSLPSGSSLIIKFLLQVIACFYFALSCISYYATVMNPSQSIKIARCMWVFHLSISLLLGKNYFMEKITSGIFVLIVLQHALFTILYTICLALDHPKKENGEKVQ